MDFILVFASLAFLVLSILWIKQLLGAHSSLPLPPNPKGFPILGNLLDLASDEVHVKARDWSREFGEDIISLNVMGSTMIVLNSAKAVSDIFDKRGSNYSDRPDMPMIVDLMGWDWTFALMRYGPRWKEHRRVFHSHFNHSVNEHQEIQLEISKDLLTLLLKSPDSYLQHMRHYTAHIIMKRVYGHTVVDNDDPYVRLVDEASRSTSEAAVPGAFLVDLFPSLKYVPEWMPEWRKLSEAMINVPYNMVKDKFNNGTAEPCFVSTCLEQNAASDAAGKGEILTEELIKDSAAVAYAAGADTSVSTLTTFILAMTLHPEAQKRAQVELDAVLGDRLPTFADKEDLPYVTALMKEVLRWIPVLPLAVPHRTVNSDQYKGYFIPAGASILGNTWAILHDEAVFVEPEKFKPERFIDNNLPDPADSGVFGFGRRACAGKSMALDTIWIAIASVLSVYNIHKAVDGHGNLITPEVKLEPGTISHPAPFKCRIEPRSPAALALIQNAGLGAK
ncbi:cytochrome P450 [Multifurca ochricompacta]|uniref:Cytochrome P450 n=1 Tax=Multifurca ochricompacta TaxID=376703 RepID=A0AAD4M416_9AGAM|nr:cytochrome P450 [Multifurca ochricompacta]